MEIRKQVDQDIAIHIVSKVDSKQALAEAKLSKRHGTRGKRPTRIGASLDLGLTINTTSIKAKTKSNKEDFMTSLQERYEKENRLPLQAQQQDEPVDEQASQRAIAEAEAYALTRNSYTTGADGGNSDDDQSEKENTDISGRSIFCFSAKRNKSTLNMMKKVVNPDVQTLEDNSNTVVRKRGRPRKNPIPVESKDKRQRLERKMELGKRIQGDDDDEEQGSDSESETDTAAAQEEGAGYERYFQDLHGTSKTSNNTLSKLPRLEPQEFQSILEAAPTKHGQELATLMAHHEQHFPQWHFELESGFNLVFYGYGSKRQLINKFAMETMTDGPLIVVNGFFPTITIKDIMAKILVGALEVTSIPGSLQEQVALVRGYFENKNRGYKRLYLVVHNMDGLNLRNENAQSALATLAESPNIHLVGSIDQINAGLLWDNVKSARFNWIYHDATTFDNYLVETSFENTLLMGASENGGARGVQHVLASLTSNGRGIFKVLAEYQLVEMEINNMDRGSDQVGLPYHQYYEKCREQFLVSTETGMRSQLTEFKDHKVMVTKRLADGTELLYMPLDKPTLMGIVETMA